MAKSSTPKAPSTPPTPAGSATAAAPATLLSPEELRRRAALAKQVSGSFGDIVTLLLRAPQERERTLADLEWMVIPALQAGQFAVAEAQSQETGIVAPVGAVLWALVSETVDARLSANLETQVRLEPADWRSGDIPWVIAAFGDSAVVGKLLEQLAQSIFTATPAKIRIRGEDGKPAIGRLQLKTPPPPASSANSA